MFTMRFREISPIEAHIEIRYLEGDAEEEELIAELDSRAVSLSVRQDEEHKANFVLPKEQAQQLFDWLARKGSSRNLR
jgi:hypothetical protein